METSQYLRLYRMIESTKKIATLSLITSSIALATVIGLRAWDEYWAYRFRMALSESSQKINEELRKTFDSTPRTLRESTRGR